MPRLTPTDITPELIIQTVERYWSAFCKRSTERLEDFFASEAVNFGTMSARPEPARLTVVRRSREYLQGHTSLEHTLGAIDARVLTGGIAAIAIYTFQFKAGNVAGLERGEVIRDGRATQLWILDESGALRIIHEHFSESWKAPSTQADGFATTRGARR